MPALRATDWRPAGAFRLCSVWYSLSDTAQPEEFRKMRYPGAIFSKSFFFSDTTRASCGRPLGGLIGFMMIAQDIDTIVEKIARAICKEPKHHAAGPSETGGSGAARMC